MLGQHQGFWPFLQRNREASVGILRKWGIPPDDCRTGWVENVQRWTGELSDRGNGCCWADSQSGTGFHTNRRLQRFWWATISPRSEQLADWLWFQIIHLMTITKMTTTSFRMKTPIRTTMIPNNPKTNQQINDSTWNPDYSKRQSVRLNPKRMHQTRMVKRTLPQH